MSEKINHVALASSASGVFHFKLLARWSPSWKDGSVGRHAISAQPQAGDSANCAAWYMKAKASILRHLKLPPPHQISLGQMEPVAAATRMAMVGHIFNTAIITLALLTNGLNARAIAWCLFSMAIAIYVSMRAKRNNHLRQKFASHKALSQRAVKKAQMFGAILALPWGLLPILFLDPSHQLTAMIIVTLVAGMAASGAISLAPVYPAAFAYVATVIAPAFVTLLLYSNVFEYFLLALVAICYGGFLCSLIAIVARLSIEASQQTAQLNRTLLRISDATRNINEARTGQLAWENVVKNTSVEVTQLNPDAIIETLNKSAHKLLSQKNALQENEKQISTLLNTAMDAIVSINSKQELVSANSAARRTFGLKGRDLHSIILSDLLRQDCVSDVIRFLKNSRPKNASEFGAEPSTGLIEGVARHSDGETLQVEISAASDDCGNATLIIRDITKRKTTESQLRVLMLEVNHRARNLMAVLNSIMSMTASRTQSKEEFLETFGGRLRSLLKSHDIIMKDNWKRSDLRALIESQISVSLPDVGKRMRAKGPEIYLSPKAMQNMGLALHELAINSMKYGAFSVPDGMVSIRWRVVDRGGRRALQLVWRESGGPKVCEPRGKGFGSVLLGKIFGPDVDGHTATKYRPFGLVWYAQFGPAHFESR